MFLAYIWMEEDVNPVVSAFPDFYIPILPISQSYREEIPTEQVEPPSQTEKQDFLD